MIKVSVGHSEDIDSVDAIEEILAHCKDELGDIKPSAGILFTAIDHEINLILEKIDLEFPGLELIGCTTDGEISSHEGFTEDSIVLTLIYSDTMEIKAGVARNFSKDPQKSVSDAIQDIGITKDDAKRLCITTPTSLTVSGAVVVDILQETLGKETSIYGGTAGDQWQLTQTYQFYKTEMLDDAVPFLILSGDFLYSFGVNSGWNPMGERIVISKSEGNVVQLLDDKPAIEFYQRSLGENIGAEKFSEYPLAIFEDDSENFYLRSPFQATEDGSIVFLGDVPQGTHAQITNSTRDDIIKGSETSVVQALKSYPGSEPEFAICFSCAGRKQLLGSRTEEEYELVKKHTGDLPFCGFYSYGEISPLERGMPSIFHNETFITLLLGTK